jgi:hypothetical protein
MQWMAKDLTKSVGATSAKKYIALMTTKASKMREKI